MIEDQDAGADTKSALASKTIHFNWISGLAIPAVWPFLPESFRHQDYATAAITAWFAIGNIVLRFLTSEAIGLFARRTNAKAPTTTAKKT